MGDHAQAREAIARLSRIGVRTSIDDFGTGYSSLSYLRELPVHALKIDRSFITDLIDEPDSEAIVRSIIELARNLGLETVAEGVEDERVSERLIGLGCDYVQGFAIARPMPAARHAALAPLLRAVYLVSSACPTSRPSGSTASSRCASSPRCS